MTVRKKLLTSVMAVLLASLVLLVGTVTIEAQNSSKKAAYSQAEVLARQYGATVAQQIATAQNTAEDLSQTLLAMKANGDTSRTHADQIEQAFLLSHPSLFGTWSLWEPNTFDGRDNAFRNTTGTDATGRYLPYWHRADSGGITVDPLGGYDTPGSGDYYLASKNSGTSRVLDPYPYTVNGKAELFTSTTVPMYINSTFVGVAGVDINLPMLQTFISQLHPYGTGHVTLASQNHTIVATPDGALVGKQLAAKQAIAAAKVASSDKAVSVTGKDLVV